MAKQNPPEPKLAVYRRQLLSATAAITVVGVLDSDNITTLPTGRGTSRAYTVRRPTGMSWPITAAACSTPAVRPRSYDAGWAKLREDDAGLGPVTPGCPGRL